jgi:hypothetical protein
LGTLKALNETSTSTEHIISDVKIFFIFRGF